MRNRRLVPAVLALFAAAGLVGAHVLAYLIALPDQAVRAALLSASGHGYFSAATVVAVVAAIFGSFAAAAIGLRRQQSASRALRWRYTAVRIALVQTAAFAVLEIAERAAAGVSPALIGPRLAVIGVVVQVVVAWLAAGVLLAICRVAALARRVFAGRPERVRHHDRRIPDLFDWSLPRLAFAGSFDSRAPPPSFR